MGVTKWFAVALMLVFGLAGIATAKEKKSTPKKEQWKSYAHSELAEYFFDANSIIIRDSDTGMNITADFLQQYTDKSENITVEVNTKIVPNKVGRMVKQFAYKELSAIAYINMNYKLNEVTVKRDVLKILQLNGKTQVEVVNEHPKTPSKNETGNYLVGAIVDQINLNRQELFEKQDAPAKKKREAEAKKRKILLKKIESEISILSTPTPQTDFAEDAITFPEPTDGNPWFLVGAYQAINLRSIEFNKDAGLFTAAIRVSDEETKLVAEGTARVDLNKQTVITDVNIDYENGALKVIREPKTTTGGPILRIVYAWTKKLASEDPQFTVQYGLVAPLRADKKWLLYAAAPWANFYYDPSSIGLDVVASRFDVDTKTETTPNGRKPETLERIKAGDVYFNNDYVSEYIPYEVDLENKKLYYSSVGYVYINGNDSGDGEFDMSPMELSKTQQALLSIVEKAAKEYFAKNPDAQNAYKAKHPKSRLLK